MNKRLDNLYRLLEKKRLDALLVSSTPNVRYLSGFRGEESHLFLSTKGAFFLTDFRYLEQARGQVSKELKIILLEKEGLAATIFKLVKKTRAKRIGYEADIITHGFYVKLGHKLAGRSLLVATHALVESQRIIKDAGEIVLLRKSASIAVESFRAIKKVIRSGMTEREVQNKLEFLLKERGSEKPAFDLIVACGERSAMPHCQSNQTRIASGGLVLIDMGAVYEGYHSDLTRPVFLGRIPAFVKRVHSIVFEAQKAGIAAARPGVEANVVDAACRGFIQKNGYGRFFGHSTGHGVGLEVHEAPRVSQKEKVVLKPGMVVTIEPGIYLPGRFGIRIEDMVLITETGCEVLTNFE